MFLTLRHSERCAQTSKSTDQNLKLPAGKARKANPLRTSFTSLLDEDNESEPSAVITLKRSNLSRIAIQRYTDKRSSVLASALTTRQLDGDKERPSYSAASLQELNEYIHHAP